MNAVKTEPAEYPKEPCPQGHVRIFFIGHSTLLIEFGQIRILTDPIFSMTCSPVRGSGPRRFSPPGIPFEQLPPIDAVIVSHNHYDHLDRPTILRLGNEPRYIVPLGLRRWFRRRRCKDVHELDWWQSMEIEGMKITATPAQHWSKRTPLDTNKTLWCSFVIEAGLCKLFFMGDSGYFAGFKRIRDRFGAMTIAALPIGAYAPRWFMRDIHMNPEDAVRAFDDLRAKHFVAIHHSTFQLTDEMPDEPPRRLEVAWRRAGHDRARLWIPQAGEHRLF